MKMNGIAHVGITVSNFKKCNPFYRQLFGFLEMQLVYDSDSVIYGVGSRTGIAVKKADAKFQGEVFEQNRIGLHHFCFRARAKSDIDKLYDFLINIDAKIVRAPEEGSWAQGYYSVLFEDPDGIRIEANYIPGKGNLDPKVKLPLAE
ncbi:MAG: VOC family protein [Pseudomonadota bacterium]|uniref:VOC domain-containing protein n=1 Tax=marine metagenome TaxID=408172 RepID=A0A382YTF9_9ZZZZ|nr:VOC family protein [Zunongwangia profunda]MAX03479.1 bleomycin resistance protein [Gammaproteobacteria bacterium]MEC9218633.1 VOC family protein [Pseudomonadota bacterium]MBC59660.1 bleomycin resistance protein [Gammaproteobacteria bacterium]MEC9299616.1 VOC family protein [Pseudomonadota bacterium]MED5387004.1 VOC family protein [Pseudomonadota bacterium]|tara:strand:+ start:1267 stop:1707 length:441 start_codon:yes stop_codon:yes gene_type:complete